MQELKTILDIAAAAQDTPESDLFARLEPLLLQVAQSAATAAGGGGVSWPLSQKKQFVVFMFKRLMKYAQADENTSAAADD